MQFRHRWCVVLLIGLLTRLASGQVAVECRVDQVRALCYEPVYLTVRIQNNHARSLIFSGEGRNAELAIHVERVGGGEVPFLQAPDVGDPSFVFPGGAGERKFNLQRTYDIRDPGAYATWASVSVDGIGAASEKIFFNVASGVEVARLTAGAGREVAGTRTYRLLSAFRDRTERLFLNIADEPAHQNLGVFDLGRMIRSFPPVLRIDSVFDLHVLHQVGPGKFSHAVYSPEGDRRSQTYYRGAANTIRLEMDEDGKLAVAAGERIPGGEESDAAVGTH